MHESKPRDMTEHLDPETGFLEQLGQRVRTMRALRGMSRKVLAKVSGISERYIAQLESGKGNVSIVLLRRVSNAMGAHLEDLIPATEPSPDWPVLRDLVRKATPSQIAQAKDVLAGQSASAQRRISFAGIALIGLRGAGKSTLGRMLAQEIGFPFIELNRVIEQEYGASVSMLIELSGVKTFRRHERACLEKVIAENDKAVIATAGGIVSNRETYALLLRRTHSVWVTAQPQEHMQRVMEQGDFRPMAENREAMSDLVAILAARGADYAKAQMRLDTSGEGVEQSFDKLARLVAPVVSNKGTAS